MPHPVVSTAQPHADLNTLVEVRASTIQGLGVFARRPIAESTRIIEYAGEVISDSEGDARYDERAMERHHTYLMALADGRCIDPLVGGNEARFINHSCEPNCEAVEDDARVWIDALRDIAAGEELTYDYSYARSESDDETFYRCRCGAPTCRRTILAPREGAAGEATLRGETA